MEHNFNIGAMKAEALRKAFDVDIEKGRTGVYEDNAENRRLNRVGQSYGHKKEEEQKVVKTSKKTEQEQKTSAATMESAAQGASDEALKRASQDPKAPADVKAAAKKELENRGGKEEGADKQGESKKASLSVNKEVFKDYKRLNASQVYDYGFDVGEARENYIKEDEKENKITLISFQDDGTVLHDIIDAETGDEDLKTYKSRAKFMKEFAPDKSSMIANKDDFKDYKKMSSKEMFNRGFDVWGSEENYFKEDKNTGAVEIISFQKDGTVIHDHVDENGEEDLKEYKSREEFMKEFKSSKEDKKTETKEEE